MTLTGWSIIGLGLEVNVDYLAVVALDLSGRERLRRTVPVEAGAPPAVDALVALAAQVHAELTAAGHDVVGVAAAVPGLVAEDNRTISWAPNLGWDGVPLAEALERAVGDACHVTVDNDANCAAMAEASHGVARDVSHSLYLTGTVGIGAGIVQDGRMLRGGTGLAGEVGHMPIGHPDALCGCGRMGCWEASVGLRAMLTAVGMEEGPTPLQTAVVVAGRAVDDADVRTALAMLGRELGTGLATLANVLDPSVIVLGGYFVPLGEHILPSAAEVLADRLPSAAVHVPEIRLSTLGIHAAALGAAELALSGIFTGAAGI